jgi:hypothetical protein
MGKSTDAILFYGFPLDEDCGEYSWVKYDDKYDPANLPGGVDEDDWLALYNHRTEKSYSEKDLPVTIGHHCSDECTMHYLAIQASERTANRGYPAMLEVSTIARMMQKNSEWNQQLREFCEVMEIEYQEPNWYICSWEG